jgi:hypothetical protein
MVDCVGGVRRYRPVMVETCTLTKHYGSRVVAVDDLTLSIPEQTSTFRTVALPTEPFEGRPSACGAGYRARWSGRRC